MNKEIFNKLKKELISLAILLFILLILFKIVFFKETIAVTLRTVFGVFWLFILPGYSVMFYWQEKLGFAERAVIGTALSAAIIGSFSYYIGLTGLNIKYHGILLPIILILAGFYFYLKNQEPIS